MRLRMRMRTDTGSGIEVRLRMRLRLKLRVSIFPGFISNVYTRTAYWLVHGGFIHSLPTYLGSSPRSIYVDGLVFYCGLYLRQRRG